MNRYVPFTERHGIEARQGGNGEAGSVHESPVTREARQALILHPVCILIDRIWAEQEADLQRRHDEHQSAIERAQQRWGM